MLHIPLARRRLSLHENESTLTSHASSGNNIRQHVRCSETNENVRMISGTSYCRRDGIHVSNNSADVRMKISRHVSTIMRRRPFVLKMMW